MVFKKRSKARRKSYSVKAKKSYKRSKSNLGSNNLMGSVIGGMSYGALRSYGSEMAKPITDKMGFLGVYADNVVMATISYALATGKIPFINNIKVSRDIGKAGLVIESAFAGVDLKNQVMGTGNSVTTGTDNRF